MMIFIVDEKLSNPPIEKLLTGPRAMVSPFLTRVISLKLNAVNLFLSVDMVPSVDPDP